jgi:hypothetical protein
LTPLFFASIFLGFAFAGEGFNAILFVACAFDLTPLLEEGGLMGAGD